MPFIDHVLSLGDPESPKVFSLKETNTFVDEYNFEYRDHTKTNFVVEVYGYDDLSNAHTHWAGLEETYFPTYAEALECFARELLEYAEFRKED